MTGAALHLGVLIAALLFDRLVGDPAWLWSRAPHPVVLMGRLLDRFDTALNSEKLSAEARRRRGVFAVLALVAGAVTIGMLFQRIAAHLPFGFAAEALIVAVLLAQKSLVDHVAAVVHGLCATGLDGGRQAVARIVGRDVSALDEAGVSRAAIESAAENFSDGLVAPAFCYAVLGLPGLLVFKFASTADSMIGHRTPRHEAFGWAAARLDDALNFIPARISALLLAAAAALSSAHAREALRAAFRDAKLHKSPNAGWPEAALAGALGLALGGPRKYGAIFIEGAWLNPAGRQSAAVSDVQAAIRLIDIAWALMVASVALAFSIALWTGR